MNDRAPKIGHSFSWVTPVSAGVVDVRRIVRIGLMVLLGVTVFARSADAVDIVQAGTEQSEAWAGEPVLMIVTLYSPGPFSGTPSFDLPELPSTAIVRMGRPLVGNETIDGDSWFTQRHELRIFTQQTGEVVIPPFLIRFEGKRTFTSDPEPMEGRTPELSFQSRRPPGTEGTGLVSAAANLTVQQTWDPDAEDLSIEAGDIVQREVVMNAEGTTAMLMPTVVAEAPEHVRVYQSEPVVEDRISRGESGSSRRETIKFQFEQPGTFELPPLEIVWWNYREEKLHREVLDGRTITVTGRMAVADESMPEADSARGILPVIFVLLATVAAWLLYQPLRRRAAVLKQQWQRPEAVAGRQLMKACRENDAPAAYAAVLAWNRLTRFSPADPQYLAEAVDQVVQGYRAECDELASVLFSAETNHRQWQGARLRSLFGQLRRARQRTAHRSSSQQTLAALNPAGTLGDSR